MFIHQPGNARVCCSRVDLSKVRALKSHEPDAQRGFNDVDTLVSTPLSEVDVSQFLQTLEDQKAKAAVIFGDLSDGKRRVNAAKGPKKRAKPTTGDSAESGDSE